jgi:pyruvate dehydrogenase E2 component (dihydrolipoamide acetyltransferase)
MAICILMPKVGITVESCIIGEWLKKPGDPVSEGDVLFTYETDKATLECESTASGTLLERFYENGDEVPCLISVCAIGEPGEDVSSLRPEKAGAAEQKKPAAAPAAKAAAVSPVSSGSASGAVSPRAKDLAARSGADLSSIAGTGPDGRVIERDVRRVLAEGPDLPAPAPEAASAAQAEFEDVRLSTIRKTIARTMFKSLSGMAQLTHNFSFDASALLACRARFKAEGGDSAGITLGDMILFAVSRTLLSCPDLNAHMLEETSIRRFKHVQLGVAVDTERGLMVPTIRDADTKSLLEISKEVKELAAACRAGNINPDLLSGGSFTVSNLGGFGVESFSPVINPPQTGLLGVCTIVQRPRAAKDRSIQLYPAMPLSLTYDHRALDGAPASRYVQGLCRKLENFTELLSE